MSNPSKKPAPLTLIAQGPVGKALPILGGLGADFIRYPGETSVIVAGRPGSWKGVAFVIPNLLMAPRPPKQKFESYLVTDYSGELNVVCHRRLRELGNRIVVFASDAERRSAKQPRAKTTAVRASSRRTLNRQRGRDCHRRPRRESRRHTRS